MGSFNANQSNCEKDVHVIEHLHGGKIGLVFSDGALAMTTRLSGFISLVTKVTPDCKIYAMHH